MAATVSKAGPYYASGEIKFSDLRRDFRAQQRKQTSGGSETFDTDTASISAAELLRVTDQSTTNPIVPNSTENADIGYNQYPSIEGVTVLVNDQSYTIGGTSYPVRGRLWIPTSLVDTSIDLVVAYHGTIGLDPSPGATTILNAADTNLTLLKGNEIGIDDKIIFSVAYPQDGITVTQNLNLLTQAQLSTFEFGDNLPYARAALLWAKNNLNSYIADLGGTKTIKNVHMFGHSQGGSLVHKLNTLETTDGVVVNAPGPIRLDITCANQENLGLVGDGNTLNPTNVTCQKLFNAYGSAETAPEYQDVSLLYNYVTGHKAKITYLQSLDDPTGGTSGVGQVVWMNELIAAMKANGQSYEYITVPTGGHDAFYKPQNTKLHRAIRGVVGGYGVNLKTSQFRNSIKYYYITQSGTNENFDIDAQSWNTNLNKSINKFMFIDGTCGSSDTGVPAASLTASCANMTIDISGLILGAAGLGGSSNGGTGGNGGSALFVGSGVANGEEVKILLNSTSQVYAGGGGGGGGIKGAQGSSGTCYNWSYYSANSGCEWCGSCGGGQQIGGCNGIQGCNCFIWCRNTLLAAAQCRKQNNSSKSGGEGGNGGSGGNGRGYNWLSPNSLSGNAGSSGASGNCNGYDGTVSTPGTGATGKTGANGGNWGANGSSNSNTGSAGSAGSAIYGTNYSVIGASSDTIKGSYAAS